MIGGYGDSMSSFEYEGIKLHLHVYVRFGSRKDFAISNLIEKQMQPPSAGAKTCILSYLSIKSRERRARLQKNEDACYSSVTPGDVAVLVILDAALQENYIRTLDIRLSRCDWF